VSHASRLRHRSEACFCHRERLGSGIKQTYSTLRENDPVAPMNEWTKGVRNDPNDLDRSTHMVRSDDYQFGCNAKRAVAGQVQPMPWSDQTLHGTKS
jgi:hypothetical protein